MRPEPEATGRRGTTESRCRVSGQSETGSGEGLGRAAVAHERRRVAGAARFPRLDRRLAVRRGLPVRPMARVRRLKPALAPEFAGLLAAAITRMVAVVGDADPVEPSQRVRIGVTDSVDAHRTRRLCRSVRMSRGQPTMPWSDGLCQGQRYPSHREGGWIVIAVWLTLNSSADGAGLLEQPGHRRPAGTGSGYRPVPRNMPTSTARSVRSSSQSISNSAKVRV
jgi:hypothetical protein